MNAFCAGGRQAAFLSCSIKVLGRHLINRESRDSLIRWRWLMYEVWWLMYEVRQAVCGQLKGLTIFGSHGARYAVTKNERTYKKDTKERHSHHRVPPFFSSSHKNRLLCAPSGPTALLLVRSPYNSSRPAWYLLPSESIPESESASSMSLSS